MNIQLDDGVQFGLGVFETICLKEGKPVLLERHLERMNESLKSLGIQKEITLEEAESRLKEQLPEGSEERKNLPPLHALKIMASGENTIMVTRSNPYTEERIRKGFSLAYSAVKRNETSPLVFHKTMNYGDNILEKRRTAALPIDEVLFLNTRGELTEGSTTNLFLVINGALVTPKVSCGLLPGVLRRFVLEHEDCQERVLYPEDVQKAEECFVTNSLMGIMPVRNLEEKQFTSDAVTGKVLEEYQAFLHEV